MKIIPYMEINGCRTLLDTQLREIYDLMVFEENYFKVFYGAGSPKTFEEFLVFLKTPANQVVVATEDDKPVILVWVNEQVKKRGIINFCTFNTVSIWKKIEVTKKVVKMLSKVFDVLVGFTPEGYADTRKFIRRVGFKEIGIIPRLAIVNGEEMGSVISYFCKEE